MEEAFLIQALRQQQSAAFSTLITRYQNSVYNTVLGMLQQPEDAEDVVQEVFISVYQHIHQFRGEAKLSTWIYRIAVTKSLEALRRQKRRGNHENEELTESISNATPGFQHPGLQLEQKELGTLLFKALELLPGQQKSVFVLHKMEGLSYAEIGEILELSLSSVESLMYRARQNLQKLLAKYYDEYGK